MPGIFISHSWKDKDLVNKLTVDLLSRGFPVWLDSWEMSVSDSLIDKIYKAIDESFFLLTILSNSSDKSRWVTKEINAALMKEEELDRKFIIPIKIDECNVPLKLRERIHVDLSKGYLAGIELLDSELRKWGVEKIDIPVSNQKIPLSFIHFTDVNTSLIEKTYDHLRERNFLPKTLSKENIYIIEEEKTKLLRNQFMNRIDNIENDPYYSSEFHQSILSYYDTLKNYESQLKNGVCLILGNYSKGHHFNRGVALYWYCRLLRSRIMDILRTVQIPKEHNDNVINFKEEQRVLWNSACLISNLDFNDFYNISESMRIDIGDPGLGYGSSHHFSFRVDRNCSGIEDFVKNVLPEQAAYVLSNEEFSKFAIPQMLSQAKPDNYIWSMQGKMVAIS
ncbi:MAG: hypothetical protein ACI9Y7_002734 [Dokdonia sp.]|jgi:hypothetical protein